MLHPRRVSTSSGKKSVSHPGPRFRESYDSRAAKRGCFKRGGFPIWTCPSFFVLFVLFGTFPIFWDFPDLLGDGPGIFPICPFPLSRPIKSTYEEQSRKGPRHNLNLSRKKWETPGFGNPPGLASLKRFAIRDSVPLRSGVIIASLSELQVGGVHKVTLVLSNSEAEYHG